MPNISSDLSNTKQDQPEVEVLLATFNGSEHIAEFLNSLSNQEGVSIHLKVSDDGSSDRTLEIIESYKSKFESVSIEKGPLLGPMENFFSLIEKASLDYIALADQDDIWFSNHLYNSCTRVMGKTPKITFSRVSEFKKISNKNLKVWPKKLNIKTIENLIFENQIRGCTIVFNKSFLELVKQSKPKKAIMHDWWLALLGLSTNSLIINTSSEVMYRIHKNNFIGTTPSFHKKLLRFIKILKSNTYPTLVQLRDLKNVAGHFFSPDVSAAIDKWVEPLTFQKLLKQICTKSPLRMNLFEDFLLRISFVLTFIKKSKR
jgi:glycosyltransferase involved in cell wall biosynthesis